METEPKIVQRNLQEVGSAQGRRLCFPTNKTEEAIHIMESRPLLQNRACSAIEIGSQFSLCLPAILSNWEGCMESRRGKSKNNINNSHNPSLGIQLYSE